MEALLQSNLPFPVRRGKVRDVYDLGKQLLIVATDRISAFDCVMPNGIPDKGKVLTQLSNFWFKKFQDGFDNHLLATEVRDFPQNLQPFAKEIAGRGVFVKKTSVIPIECVARGYLAGTGWKEYYRTHTVCGLPLPHGLKQSDQLPQPIFTPAIKDSNGHDINISYEELEQRVGTELAATLRDRTLALYTAAADFAATRGVIIADTKFEFGKLPDGRVILIDEVLTPDSSRFWPAAEYEPGHDQPSFDKQFVRNYLDAQPWNRTHPAPELPPEVTMGTRERYLQAYRKLTGKDLNLG